MFSLNGTFLLVFLSFLGFMFLMRAVYFEPVRRVKDEREATVEAGKNAASDAESKKQLLSVEYQERIAAARRDAQKLIRETREQAKVKAGERIAVSRQQATGTVEEQLLQLKASREAVYQSLQSERDDLAKSIVDKLSERQKSVAGKSTSSALS